MVQRDLHRDDEVVGGTGDRQHALYEEALVPQQGMGIAAVAHRQGDLRRAAGCKNAHDPHPAIMT
jgi:hypothetical protein